MDNDFLIEDSATETTLEVWLAQQYLSSSKGISDALACIFPVALPTVDGVDHSLIRQAVGLYKGESEELSKRVWHHVEGLSDLNDNCVERAVRMLRTLSIDAERKIAGRVFESYEPKRNWDNPVLRSIHKRFLDLGNADHVRSHVNFESIEKRARVACLVSLSCEQRNWLQGYLGINSKRAWTAFRATFPNTKKAVFDALFIEVKGQRKRGRPANATA